MGAAPNDDSVNRPVAARSQLHSSLRFREGPGVAFRLLFWDVVEDKASSRTGREVAGARRREDRMDAILRWVHRLLNPPTPAPATMSKRRRVRDRVPI